MLVVIVFVGLVKSLSLRSEPINFSDYVHIGSLKLSIFLQSLSFRLARCEAIKFFYFLISDRRSEPIIIHKIRSNVAHLPTVCTKPGS